MEIPDNVKKWLASLDKDEVKQFVMYMTGRFINELLPKLLKDWSCNRRGQ